MSTTGSMGWADEHELEETRSVKGPSNPIGARDIERERMSEQQIRDQFTRAHRWQIFASTWSGSMITRSRVEKLEPRDVHELCRPHDAESRSARDVMRVRRCRKRLQRFSLATADGSGPAAASGVPCGGVFQAVKAPPLPAPQRGPQN